MDEGAFDQNFTWYEWGFVNPAEIPHDDLAVPPDSSSPRTIALPTFGPKADLRPQGGMGRPLEQWDEEH